MAIAATARSGGRRPGRRPRRGVRRVGEPAARPEQLQLADTAYTGGSRVVTSDHVAPASPEPNTSPVVEPK
jgi:hypothetical protein